jgi:hypothetical protein
MKVFKIKEQKQNGFGVVLLLDVLFVVFGIAVLIFLISKNSEGLQNLLNFLKSLF